MILLLVVWNAWTEYDDKHSTRISVVATLDEWQLFPGAGMGAASVIIRSK
jgi:hypothetical protein